MGHFSKGKEGVKGALDGSRLDICGHMFCSEDSQREASVLIDSPSLYGGLTRDIDFSIKGIRHFEYPALHVPLDVLLLLCGDVEGQLQDLEAIGMVYQHAVHLVTDSRVLVVN